jgi:hypothetical protein
MKSLKKAMPILAFVFAVIGAFASDSFLVSAMGINPTTLQCVNGTINNLPSGKTCAVATSGTRCTVLIPFGVDDTITVNAWVSGGTCSTNPNEALFYQ